MTSARLPDRQTTICLAQRDATSKLHCEFDLISQSITHVNITLYHHLWNVWAKFTKNVSSRLRCSMFPFMNPACILLQSHDLLSEIILDTQNITNVSI